MRQILVTLLFGCAALPALACGPDTDCMVGERSYRIVMPEGHDGSAPVPVIAYAHGYQGSSAGVMRNGSLRGLASDLGAALIAFNSAGGSWILPNHPRQMDSDGSGEFEYVDAVLEDATARFPLDGTRIMATGFSGGGMLIWNLACAQWQLCRLCAGVGYVLAEATQYLLCAGDEYRPHSRRCRQGGAA